MPGTDDLSGQNRVSISPFQLRHWRIQLICRVSDDLPKIDINRRLNPPILQATAAPELDLANTIANGRTFLKDPLSLIRPSHELVMHPLSPRIMHQHA